MPGHEVGKSLQAVEGYDASLGGEACGDRSVGVGVFWIGSSTLSGASFSGVGYRVWALLVALFLKFVPGAKRTCLGRLSGSLIGSSFGGGPAVLEAFVRISVSSLSIFTCDGGRLATKWFGFGFVRASRISSAAARIRSALVAMGIGYLSGTHVIVSAIHGFLVKGLCTR